MFRKVALTFILATAFLPAALKAGDPYFFAYTITALTPGANSTTVSLQGAPNGECPCPACTSTWTINAFNTPNTTMWPNPSGLFIIPVLQAGGWGSSVQAVLIVPVLFSSAFAQITSVSSNLTISSFDNSSGAVTLSDGSNWQLDPNFQKYYANWQIGDFITPAGYHVQEYLINGTQSFSGARHLN